MAEKEIRQARSMAAPAADSEKMIIEGKAISFDDRTLLYKTEDGLEFFEEISSGALASADLSDCCLKYNHSDDAPILARTRGGSLKTEIKPDGLYFRAELFNTQIARDCFELIKAGALQCSFAFTVSEESYDSETRTRKILKIDHIYDLSVVDIPAYKNTFVAEARSYFEPKAAEIRTLAAQAELRELLKPFKGDPLGLADEKILDEVRAGSADPRDCRDRLLALQADQSMDIFAKLDEVRQLTAYIDKTPVQRGIDPGDTIPEKRGKMNEKELEIRALQSFVANGLANMTAEERSAITISGAAAVLPTTIYNDIISDEKFSDLLSRANKITAPNAGTLKVPVAATNAAAWHTEGQAVDPDHDEVTSLDLGGFEVMKITEYSAAVKAMTAEQFISWLQELLQVELVETLEQSFIDGTGEGQPTGIEHTDGVATIDAAGDKIAAADIANGIAALPQKYARNAIVLCNAATAYALSLEVSSNDNQLKSGALSVLGKEICISEFIDDGVAYVCNPKQLYVRFAQEPSLEIDTSSGFTAALTRMRILAVVDAKWNPKAIKKVAVKE